MPRLTEGQLAAAKDVDLLSFLSARRPDELVRTGTGEYRTVTHGSLVIRPDYWYWNKGGIGSRSAVDYLVKVDGMGFIDAAREVLSTGLAREPAFIPFQPRARQAAKPKRPAFLLPAAAANNDDLTRYLLGRGISLNVINEAIADGNLYESKYLGSPVCVFVGRDADGKARFASIRGTGTDIKKDVAGSDKAHSFTLPAQDPFCSTLTVFEAPIDALSHQTLGELGGWERGGWRLSLGGTTHVALEAFLDRHREIRRVVLHMDGDAAGITGALRIRRRIESDSRFAHVCVSVSPTRGAKDYNERLLQYRTNRRQRQEQRKEEPRMQDEINEKSMSLGARVGEITAEELKKAVDKLAAALKSEAGKTMGAITGKASDIKHGKQTMRSLAKHNAGLSSIELKDPNLRLLNKTMRQNGVDFVPIKDGKGRYTLFFKGRDADALTHAFSQYTKRVTERTAKPSIGATLAAMRQAAKALADGRDKVKNLDKGERAL
jgi:hypothetical protein